MSASHDPTNNEPPVVLITGAAHRIGKALTEAFAGTGWSVGIHYRNSKDAADHLAKSLLKKDIKAATFAADLANEDDLNQLIKNCAQDLGVPTCLVNNASEFHEDSFEDMTTTEWSHHLDANLKAPVFLAQAFARTLPAETSGSIINIVDQRVWRIRPEFFSYTVSKAALWTATQMMAQALGPKIRVNAIGPGPTLQSIHQTPEEFEAEYSQTLLKRPPAASEIAEAALFLANSPSITGQMLALDSGQHLS